MISVCFQGKPFNVTVIQVYAPTSNAEEAEIEWFYDDLQDVLQLTPKKRCSFHYRGLKCKSRKSRNTRSKSQIWLWNTEWSRAKANRVLSRECAGHSKCSLPITQEMTLNGHHQMVTPKSDWLYSFAAKEGEALYSQQKEDQELTVAQFMTSLLPNSDLNWRK